MSKLKEAIFKEIRATRHETQTLDDDEINDMVFHHRDGLRLSYPGYLMLSKIFTPYQFAITYQIKSKHRMALDKMEYPYYITSSKLVLFSDSDALVIKLAGSVDTFLETTFQLGR